MFGKKTTLTLALSMGFYPLVWAQVEWEPRVWLSDVQESLDWTAGTLQGRWGIGRGAAAPVGAVGSGWAYAAQGAWKGPVGESLSLSLQKDAFEKGIDYRGFSASARNWVLGDMQIWLGQGLMRGQGSSPFAGMSPLGMEKWSLQLKPYRGFREGYALRGLGKTWTREHLRWGFAAGQRKLDARFLGSEFQSLDLSGDRSSLLAMSRRENLRQRSLLLFAEGSFHKLENNREPAWIWGIGWGLHGFRQAQASFEQRFTDVQVWGRGPLGYGHLAWEWAKVSLGGPGSWVFKYSQALSRWSDWGLQFSQVSGRLPALSRIGAEEELPEGTSALLLWNAGPAWRHVYVSSQWQMEALVGPNWQNRLGVKSEHRKAKPGELSMWSLDLRLSQSGSNWVVQSRAQLRWALAAPSQNHHLQWTAQIRQLGPHAALETLEPQGQWNLKVKWGTRSLACVLYRGDGIQWAQVPSLPYQSSWMALSGNGICLRGCHQISLGKRAELQIQATWGPRQPQQAALLRMFAQVQWKA